MSGSEQSSMSSSFLTNLRILGYKILKSLEEKDVRDIDVPELGPCSKCNEEIFSFPITGFTTLTCGHTYHRLCIEKKLLNSCPFPGCGKNVDTIEARRDSQSSQSSGVLAISTLMGEKFTITSPTIHKDAMEDVEVAVYQQTESERSSLTCAKCFEDIAQVSNSSDNSNGESWFDADAFFNEPNSTKVSAITSDDDMYFKDSDSSNTDDENSSNDSDPDLYFKYDDSNSDDEYDHELHERLTREEMVKKAKLEDKTPTKPAYEEDDFDKILMEIHENDDIYFDDDSDPVPQLVMKSPIIALVTA
ncbi:hypothetical protein GLOIN_2v1734374 [Rhizophagus clarus]|uniref:RING-type domain-containing protein n=1 Tax=Rhizophagus clarus TaxID=94130 RepID=A0A8H3KW10_9GLOM|nr:hypothetical protein GLOIN_2v1734374 [Rhizophagus clarus]